jgi:hypothetical protein
MSDLSAEYLVRLKQLVWQVTKQRDPVKYDELCAKIWQMREQDEGSGKSTLTGGSGR